MASWKRLSELRNVSKGRSPAHRFESETADNSYELASDTFVIQNESIRFQAFTAKVKPKQWSNRPDLFSRNLRNQLY
jgi:hypothetical protein